jgi:hypothetical protein
LHFLWIDVVLANDIVLDPLRSDNDRVRHPTAGRIDHAANRVIHHGEELRVVQVLQIMRVVNRRPAADRVGLRWEMHDVTGPFEEAVGYGHVHTESLREVPRSNRLDSRERRRQHRSRGAFHCRPRGCAGRNVSIPVSVFVRMPQHRRRRSAKQHALVRAAVWRNPITRVGRFDDEGVGFSAVVELSQEVDQPKEHLRDAAGLAGNDRHVDRNLRRLHFVHVRTTAPDASPADMGCGTSASSATRF